MSAVDRFDQRFDSLLEELGAATYPDYFDDVLDDAMRPTQRPAWTFPERWLPMGVLRATSGDRPLGSLADCRTPGDPPRAACYGRCIRGVETSP